MAIKTRETTADGVTNKGAPLTNAEVDNNFVELQQNKLEAADLVAADTNYDNTDSGLVASNVQSAIDEIQDKKLNIADLAANVVFYPTSANSDISTYFKLVTSTEDADYDGTAVDISTGTITTTDQFIAALASEAGVLNGSTGVISITTVGNVRRVSGFGQADFYFEVYKRTSGGTETLMGTSNSTPEVSENTYEQFYAACLITATTFTETDRIVFKYYGNRTGGIGDSAFEFQFGGTAPVRSNLPVPVNVVSHANNAEDIIVDTSNFAGILSGADDDVQAALDTLDDHTHDLSDLSDVYSSIAPTDGQLLTWDNDNSRWDAADAPVSLPDQSGNSGKYLTTDGTTASWAELPAGGLEYVVKTANYTASDKEGVLADTSGGAFTVTLPATPATGAQVVVADSGGAFATNNLTVGRNGSTIAGESEDLVLDLDSVAVQFVYDGSTWEFYVQTRSGGGGDTADKSADGGFANSVYTAAQSIDGGSASG